MANIKGSKRGPYKHHQPPRKCMYPGCNNIFTPNNSNQRFCENDHFRKCNVCGKLYVDSKPYGYGPATCSKDCAYEMRHSTMRERYGVGNALESEQFLRKARNTNLKHRGVEYPMQDKHCLDKRVETCLSRFGVPHPMKSDVVKSKLSNTISNRYGVNWACQTRNCRYSVNTISSYNRKFADMLVKYGIPSEFEYPLDKYSYDIHVPNTNVLIEIDPTDTHNSISSPFGHITDSQYHRLKSKCAQRNGFICIHVFDWNNIEEIVKDLKWSKYFDIQDRGIIKHWYNSKSHIHIIDDDYDEADMIADGFLSVFDDGFNINFIY